MTDQEEVRPRTEKRRKKGLIERLDSFLKRANERAKEREIQWRYGSFAATHPHHTSGGGGDIGLGGGDFGGGGGDGGGC